MFNFSEVYIEEIIVHSVGNKQNVGAIALSETPLQLDDKLKEMLVKYFISPFKSDAFYSFTDPTAEINYKKGNSAPIDETIQDLESSENEDNTPIDEDLISGNDIKSDGFSFENNPAFCLISEIFESPINFVLNSKKLAELLHQKSAHSKIRTGEFYVVLFHNCVVDEEFCSAIGLFKSETKETYLKVFQTGTGFKMNYETGININKLDKGCLIFNTEKDFGYKVSIIDNMNKKEEARYWKTDFLNLKMRENNFYNTDNYMKACKAFVDEVFNDANQVEKADQINLLNKSVQYFKEHDQFNESEFADEVMMGEPEIIKAFNEYKNYYQNENNVQLENEFSISNNAVKGNQKFFKSILKLDKNFHIYIHGNRERIQKGFDEGANMHYYKIYFENEI